jgi:hypothetical protein
MPPAFSSDILSQCDVNNLVDVQLSFNATQLGKTIQALIECVQSQGERIGTLEKTVAHAGNVAVSMEMFESFSTKINQDMLDAQRDTKKVFSEHRVALENRVTTAQLAEVLSQLKGEIHEDQSSSLACAVEKIDTKMVEEKSLRDEEHLRMVEQVGKLEASISQLDMKAKEQGSLLNDHLTTLDTLRSDFGGLSSELEQQTAAFQLMQEKFAELKNHLTGSISEFSSQLKKSEDKLMSELGVLRYNAEKEVAAVADRLNSTDSRVSTLQKELETLQNSIQAKAEAVDVAQNTEKIDTLDGRVSEMATSLQEEPSLNDLKDYFIKQQNDGPDLQAKLQLIEEMKGRVDYLEDALFAVENGKANKDDLTGKVDAATLNRRLQEIRLHLESIDEHLSMRDDLVLLQSVVEKLVEGKVDMDDYKIMQQTLAQMMQKLANLPSGGDSNAGSLTRQKCLACDRPISTLIDDHLVSPNVIKAFPPSADMSEAIFRRMEAYYSNSPPRNHSRDHIHEHVDHQAQIDPTPPRERPKSLPASALKLPVPPRQNLPPHTSTNLSAATARTHVHVIPSAKRPQHRPATALPRLPQPVPPRPQSTTSSR